MSSRPSSTASSPKPFLSDVKTLRDRARQNLSDGIVTSTYVGDAKKTVEILQSVLATEIVCVLRYTMHAVTATGISSEAIKAEFAQHAQEEQEHMMAVAERVDQPGRPPNFNPRGPNGRAGVEETRPGGRAGGGSVGTAAPVSARVRRATPGSGGRRVCRRRANPSRSESAGCLRPGILKVAWLRSWPDFSSVHL